MNAICLPRRNVHELGPLLCQIDSFLDVGVLNDLFQVSNLRIKHLKIREMVFSN